MAAMHILWSFSALITHIVASEHDVSASCNTDKKVGGDHAEKR